VRDDGDDLVIGAMTKHAAVVRDPLINEHVPLLAQATATVADRQVRNLGTFGGALAHADPASDLPAVAVASEAVFEVAGPNGRRQITADDFFVDYLTTTLDPAEVLVAVRVPKRTGWASHYEKFNRTAQSWALIGVAALVKRSNGGIAEARVALTNIGPKPVRARAVEQALAGADKTGVAAAAAHAADGAEPSDDLNASGEYRTHLAKVLTERAVLSALA
jgi:carbon-monoxide dehydrogenase medium subunit